MGTSRGGAALGGAVVLLIMLRVALRLSRQGSHLGRLAVIVDVVVIAGLAVYAFGQNRRSGS